MLKPLKGIHHVTAITSSAEKIYHFFTYVLGLRLVKKTINQDDIQTYHLFFADDAGQAGTDMTFFDFQGSQQKRAGTNEISMTGLRVPSDVALSYYQKRFEKFNVLHSNIKTLFKKKVLEFEDFDQQKYMLISDENNQGVLLYPNPSKDGILKVLFSDTVNTNVQFTVFSINGSLINNTVEFILENNSTLY